MSFTSQVRNNEKLHHCFHSRLSVTLFLRKNNIEWYAQLCSEVLITRKRILKYNFIFIPNPVPNSQRHKNSVQKQTSIEKYAYIQMSKNWSTLWHKLQRNIFSEKKVEYQMYTFLCACLYTKVSMQLCLYMVFIR